MLHHLARLWIWICGQRAFGLKMSLKFLWLEFGNLGTFEIIGYMGGDKVMHENELLWVLGYVRDFRAACVQTMSSAVHGLVQAMKSSTTWFFLSRC